MSVQEAALKFKRWAVENHILRRGREDRAPDVESPLDFDENTNKAASSVLRAKPISFLGFDRSNEAIVVYVRARPTRADERKLPKEVDGYKVLYKKGVPATWNGKVNTPTTDPYVLVGGTYSCGSSIFLCNRLSAGTMGCLVRNKHGVILGMSNNHVTGGCNYTEVGCPILAPGPVDAGPSTIDPFTIGRHLECAPMLDGLPENLSAAGNADAALFQITDPAMVSSSQRGAYDTPSVVGPLAEGIMVMKAGRTTGLTKGKVVARAADFDAVDYEIPEMGLRKTVYYEEIYAVESSGNQPFADLGDSGSLVVEVDGPSSPRSVGLIVGVALDLSYALVLPIQPVLTFFGVDLVEGHNC